MDFELDEYVEKEEFEKMYKGAKTAEERRMISLWEIATNCLTRFRGWPANKDGVNADKEKVFDALEKNRLYFSTALGYNDPFDTLLYYDQEKFLRNIFDDWQNMSRYAERIKDISPSRYALAKAFSARQGKELSDFQLQFLTWVLEEIETMKQKIHDNIKGICFSRAPRSVLMWSHYACSHYGIALLYDKKELETAPCFDKDGNEVHMNRCLKSIVYQEKRPDATDYVNAYILNRLPSDGVTARSQPRKQDLENIILTKDNSWSYEKEVRLIPRHLDFEHETNVAYIEIKPKAIMLGAKITPEDRDCVVAIAKRLGNIKVYETWIDDQLQDYCVYVREYRE